MRPGWRKNYLRYKSYFLNVAGQYRERADIKVYLEILLSLATVTVFSVFALRPTLLTIAELIKEIEAKNKTLTILDSKIQDLSQAQSLSDQQRTNLSLLHIAIPQDPSPDIFARQIEILSQKHQTPITSFNLGKALILGDETPKTPTSQEKPQDSKTISQVEELTFSLQTEVNITNFTSSSNLLSDLEQLRRPVKIESFTFNSVENKNEREKNIIFVVNGILPYLKI